MVAGSQGKRGANHEVPDTALSIPWFTQKKEENGNRPSAWYFDMGCQGSEMPQDHVSCVNSGKNSLGDGSAKADDFGTESRSPARRQLGREMVSIQLVFRAIVLLIIRDSKRPHPMHPSGTTSHRNDLNSWLY